MLRPIPQALKICLGTFLAALLVGLQNIDEYAQQLEMSYPHLSGVARELRHFCQYTGLPQWYNGQKNFYSLLGSPVEQEPPPAPAAKEAPQPPPVVAEEIPQTLTPENKSEVAPKPVVRKKKAAKKKTRNVRKSVKRKKKTSRKTVRRKTASSGMKSGKKKAVRKKKVTRRRKRRVARKTELQNQENIPGKSAPSAAEELKEEKSEQQPEPEQVPGIEPPLAPWAVPLVETELDSQALAAANLESPVHYRIMLMGDSLMEDLGPATYRALRARKGLHFILTAKFSTGLTRPDYFNWPKNLEPMVQEHRPDLIIIFMGANDAMPIKVEGRNISPYSREEWRAAYRIKMQEILDIAIRYQSRVLWIGLPPMGGRTSALLKNTADTQQAVCESLNVPYLDTVPLLGDENGKYRTYMTDARGRMVRLRQKDMEHITSAGNDIIIRGMMPHLEHAIYDFRSRHPEKCLTPEEMQKKGNARMYVTIKYVPPKRR